MRLPAVVAGALVTAVGLMAPQSDAPRAAPEPASPRESLAQRMSAARLAEVRQGLETIRKQRREIDGHPQFRDLRCVLHCHSGLSHDSRGTPDEIAAAAAKNGIVAVFMTEHPTADRRWAREGISGKRRGVRFISGVELSCGLLAWKTTGENWEPGMGAAEVLQRLAESRSVAFIAHPEQRRTEADWLLPPFAGMEIYNTHADASDSNYESVLGDFRGKGPLSILNLFDTIRRYPREAFAAIFDEQTAVMQRWDQLTLQASGSGKRVVGIAGNDSHQNVGLSFTSVGETIQIRDALEKPVGEFPARNLPKLLFSSPKADGVLLRQLLDPYDVSMGYVNTHLMAKDARKDAREDSLFEALLAGRAYVAFDWIADPTGFQFRAEKGGRWLEMGEFGQAVVGYRLRTESPLDCRWRLMRNGAELRSAQGRRAEWAVTEPGVYRVEAWVTLAGQPRPWIYSNPICLR